MTTDEPYRWLEAIANRREYIRDQLKGGTPVFAFSRPEGVLLFGIGSGQSKIFEIYDRHGLAALGHPVDIEKIRQTVIEAAHLEGFNRAPEDVTLRRLLNFSLGTALKTSFDQIFSAPLMVECIFAEVGATQAQDALVRVSFDGTHRIAGQGVAVAHIDSINETAAATWLREQVKPEMSLSQVIVHAHAAWRALIADKAFAPVLGNTTVDDELAAAGRVVECALLDRKITRGSRYRALTAPEMP